MDRANWQYYRANRFSFDISFHAFLRPNQRRRNAAVLRIESPVQGAHALNAATLLLKIILHVLLTLVVYNRVVIVVVKQLVAATAAVSEGRREVEVILAGAGGVV